MRLTFRLRILLTLLPLVLLLAVIGSAGVVLLSRLGNSVNSILRENYDSVIAMERLNEAVERIDSSFQFSLSGQQDKARQQYAHHWRSYHKNLEAERNNITLDGEARLVDRLTRLTVQYERDGDAFHELTGDDPAREQRYYGADGLLETFNAIKDVAGQIRQINQTNMEYASREARQLARDSLIWFGIGLATAILLAMISAWRTVKTVLQPIQALTHAAVGISGGNLNQVVPYLSRDELGQLSQAFNSMARHLREYRDSQSARLLRVQQTTQATVDAFPDPVIVIDTDGCVELSNPAARRLLGVVPRPSAVSHDAAPWMPPESLRQPLQDALQKQQDYSPEGFDQVVLIGSSGRERAMLPRILAIHDPQGHTLGAAVVLQDVTGLQLLDQAKSNLVATASHELKTPLTSLRLAVHLLLEESVGPLTPKQLELLLDARENSERLLAVVNNLLDLARLEDGVHQLAMQPERPESLLREAADTIRSRADDQGVELAMEIEPGLPAISVDAARLSNALQNLLDNALTYTDRGGRISLSATSDGDHVTLSVADTGIGISTVHLPHVFEKFFRVPGQSRGRGTGLGLAIVREIVTAQRGSITCESTAGRGTTFRITLPAIKDATVGFVEGHSAAATEETSRVH